MTGPDPTQPPSTDDAGRADTGQFVVRPARPAGPGGSGGWAMLGALAAVAVVGMTVWGAASQAPPPPPRTEVVPVVTAAPAPTMPVVDVPSSDAALDELARLAGWGGCPVWRAFDVAATVGPRSVEAAIGATGDDRGFLDVPDATGIVRRIWVGGDIRAAAAAFGGSFVVREADAAWTVVMGQGRDVAVRLLATARRDGGPFWQVSGRAVPASYCSADARPLGGPDPRPARRRRRRRKAVFEAAGLAPLRDLARSASQTLPSSAAIERAAASALVPPTVTAGSTCPPRRSPATGRSAPGSGRRARGRGAHGSGLWSRRRDPRPHGCGSTSTTTRRHRAAAGRRPAAAGRLDPDPRRGRPDVSGTGLGQLRLERLVTASSTG